MFDAYELKTKPGNGPLISGVEVREHYLTVPRQWDNPDPGDTVTVFARELIAEGANERPRLVYMQGGPGCFSPRPTDNSGWIGAALKKFRVVLLDQRGTGKSQRADLQTLGSLPVAEQIRRLSLMRSDSIVADAEALRRALSENDPVAGDIPRDQGGYQQWASLGQSFGGFCNTTYLSNPHARQGLLAVFFTGGLPALDTSADDIYRATYAQTAQRCKEFYQAIPGSEDTVRHICAHLEDTEETLPTGERLSARRFRTIGINLGRSTGFNALYYLLEDPFVQVKGTKRMNPWLLEKISPQVSYGTSPLYGVLHETIYAGATQALAGQATNWAAQRIRAEVPGFAEDADPTDTSEPFFLTGEHIYPWFFEEDPALRPLAQAAQALAQKSDWTPLYDVAELRESQVPGTAAVYTPDMFVPAVYSLENASLQKRLQVWQLDDYHHNALGANGEFIFAGLMERCPRP